MPTRSKFQLKGVWSLDQFLSAQCSGQMVHVYVLNTVPEPKLHENNYYMFQLIYIHNDGEKNPHPLTTEIQ